MNLVRYTLPILVLLAAVLAALVLMRPLLPIDETRYLAVAWEMRLSGDLVHLTRNFEIYAHKPPLLFWLINLVWLLTGVSEFAGRLVGPAFAVLAGLGTALLARRLWPDDRAAGARALAVLAGFTVFLIYGSATMFDAMLTCAVLLGAGALWRIGQGGAGRAAWGLLGIAFALGTYAKGPVVLVHLLPLAILLPLWAPAAPRPAAIARGLGLAIGVGLLLVALWLVPAIVFATPEYRTELLWTQSAARVAGNMGHDRPFWFLIALLPVLLFPWGWSWRLWRGLGAGWRADPAMRFCAVWAGSALVLFSLIAGKQAHYLLPEFPALALLFGRVLGLGADRRGGSAAVLPLAGLALAALLFGAGLIPARGDLADLAPRWPALVLGLALAGLALALWRLPLLPGHLLAGAGTALALHGVIVATALYPTHDAGAIAARLAAAAPGGLAETAMSYQAQFNFAARLTAPVATPVTAEELAAWAAAHPQGTVFGPVRKAGIAAPPEATIRYMGEDIGFWPAAAVTSPGAAPAD